MAFKTASVNLIIQFRPLRVVPSAATAALPGRTASFGRLVSVWIALLRLRDRWRRRRRRIVMPRVRAKRSRGPYRCPNGSAVGLPLSPSGGYSNGCSLVRDDCRSSPVGSKHFGGVLAQRDVRRMEVHGSMSVDRNRSRSRRVDGGGRVARPRRNSVHRVRIHSNCAAVAVVIRRVPARKRLMHSSLVMGSHGEGRSLMVRRLLSSARIEVVLMMTGLV